MPGARSRIKPLSASGSSGSSLDDVSQLELHLQRQLEEDIASDAYTECDIQHQEKEIIRYLNENLNESEAYATPACESPEDSLQKTLSSSPSTELTKEYYALVPIEGQILDKELIEQDELSSAFKSFIHLQTEQLNDNNNTHYTKPTTLSLSSSHFSELNKHSISCDISKDLNITDSTSFLFENDKSKINNATSQVRKHIKSSQQALKKSFSGETASELGVSGYSPDSLILDEPSSSSDYLSAGHSASPPGPPDNPAKMNNTTVSDSGIDNNGVLGSQNGYVDVTLTDVSSTESTFHDLLNDETLVESNSATDLIVRPKLSNMQPGTLPIVEMSGRSSKDEKQRQNEEIIIMESSSLSSETGSWEPVFPPKLPKRDLCEKFIKIERQNSIEPTLKSRATETARIETYQCIDEAQKSSNKSACCFIDAASLADEEENQEQVDPFTVNISTMYHSSSQPVPCGSKQVLSPNDVSENNDIDDSLEQADLDSIQKDISPTIFEMNLAPDDYVAVNENVEVPEQEDLEMQAASVAVQSTDVKNCVKSLARTVFMTSTPNNSIISLKESNILTNNEYPDMPRPSHTIRQDIICKHYTEEFHDTISPIIVPIEDNLPHEISLTENSLISGSGLFTKRKIKSTPTTCSHILPQKINSESTSQASCASAWVVDMSKIAELDTAAANRNNKKPGDKTCDSLKASSKSASNSEGCKSRSSVDSDSSEKSTQRFYIDLSTLPDALAPEIKSTNEANNEKKNIFSMFIDLGENSNTVKEMPARLSLNTKKSSKIETKYTNTKNVKANKKFPGIISADDTFEKLEMLCNSSQLSISAILRNDISMKVEKEKNPLEKAEIQDIHRTHPREGIAPTIREESDDQLGDIFVRLSDLDRAPVQNDETAPKTAIFERMSRSIPDDNQWGESSHTSNRSIDIISSFHSENALSLNRLFPHLKTSNVISRSMPGALSGRTLTPLRLCGSSILGNRDEVASDISELSSLQSSMCRSVVENSTTEETSHTASILANCQSRLGQDLLRMFVEEIAPDVVVEVSGRRIKAHKCILSSRCQYFAGILSGGWVASTGNVISLPPFSYNVAHFALCHIYSGVSVIPDTISIVELATIADMLSLEGLKEAIMFKLKAKYCHHFHEPCKVCTAGVLECFPLTSAYGLDDLYQRCLRWITRYFRTVWPTKAYATLPADLLEKCYQEQMLNLTTHNLIDIVHDCGLTEASLKQCRWSEVVAQQCRRLAEATARFAATRFSSVVRAYAAARAPVEPAAAHALDLCLASAALSASPNELCRALALLHATLATLAPHAPPAPPDHSAESLAALQRRCEKALYRAAPRAQDVPAFYELPSDLQLRLHRYINAAPTARGSPGAPAIAPRQHRTHFPTSAPVMDRDRTAFALYAQRSVRVRQPPPGLAPPPLRPLALTPSRPVAGSSAMSPRVRTTKAQEERAKYNMTKSISAKPRVKSCGTTPKAPALYGNAKPRYLKTSTAEQAARLAQRKPRAAHMSPSDTSRTQSPAPAPAPRTADPSTESLSDSLNGNKYATYTKFSRNNARKPPPIQQPAKSKTNTDNESNKTRATKIPIYSKLAMPRKRIQASAARTSESAGASGSSGAAGGGARPRGSLMMATKSSSAKMVPKIMKGSKTVKHDSGSASRPAGRLESQSPRISDIPIMERSGTFLKDEPTFGDKTTNFDIYE